MTAPLTDGSRRTHGGLTERSLTTHDRKGREGKGRELEGNGKGSRGETSHPFVQYLSARAATEPSDAHQPHATAPSWMRADR